jgi:hypothetical protein
VPVPRPPRRLWTPVALLLAACATSLTLAAPMPASASPQLQTGIADDGILLFDQERAPSVVGQWAEAGVDVVRITVRWVAIAPDALAPAQPLDFDPTNPDDPRYFWDPVDRAVELVRSAGMEPILAVTGSGPLWSSRVPALGNPRYLPDPVKFGQFATAVARRYGPVASKYLIWNEPNQPLWLQPQQECLKGQKRCTPVAPHAYRALVRAAYPAIHAADPDAQVIAGTLAPRGADPTKRNRPLRPLAFIRAFGCVDDRMRRVRTGRCAGFQPARIDGFAYHPHAVKAPPTAASPQPDDAAMGDLGKLEDTLDAVQAARGFTTPTGAPVPLHLTEFGYQTNPPDRYDGIPPARASRWLQQAAYMAWRDPRVRTLVQYVWQDEKLRAAGGGRRQAAGWQSGLLFADGRPKPALGGFQRPFFADTTVAAPKVRFWGQVRPGTTHAILLQRRSPSSSFVTVRRLVTDARGAFTTALAVPRRGGAYRFRTLDVATFGFPPPRMFTSDVLTVTPQPRAPRLGPPRALTPPGGSG